MLFLLAYVLVNRGVIAAIPDSLQLAREWSIPESLGYAKWTVGALALGWCWLKTRETYLWALALLLVMLAADDALLIHETYGRVVAEKLHIPHAFAMDPKEIGEIIVSGLLGVCALVLLAVAFFQADRQGKALTLAIFFVILGLGVTGVLLDAAHHMTAEVGIPRLRRLLGLGLTVLEDGGETVLTSVMLSICILAAAERTAPVSSRLVRQESQADIPRSIRK